MAIFWWRVTSIIRGAQHYRVTTDHITPTLAQALVVHASVGQPLREEQGGLHQPRWLLPQNEPHAEATHMQNLYTDN